MPILDDRLKNGRRWDFIVKLHDRPNAFARLSASIARELAAACANVELEPSPAGNELPLHPPRTQHRSMPFETVDFLVMEVYNPKDGAFFYVSYNGGDFEPEEQEFGSVMQENTPCIELPRAIFPDHYTVPLVVSVRVVPTSLVPIASSLALKAMSPQDYALLSDSADWLEQGGLLQQVSVVFPHQELKVLAHNSGERIRLLVLPSQSDFDNRFSEENIDSEGALAKRLSCIWEESVESHDVDAVDDGENHTQGALSDPTKRQCWRLMDSTELIILPPHQSPSTRVTSCKLFPSRLDYPTVKLIPETVPQGCALINPLQLRELVATVSPATSQEESGIKFLRISTCVSASVVVIPSSTLREPPALHSQRRILRIAISDQVPFGYIAIHPLARLELKLQLAKDFVDLEMVKISDVVDACSVARFLGVKLQPVRLQRQQVQPAWRYPSTWRETFNLRQKETVAVDSRLIDYCGTDDAPIPIGSILELPLQKSEIMPPYRRFFRLIVDVNDGTNCHPLSTDEIYVFAKDIRRLLNNAHDVASDSEDHAVTHFHTEAAASCLLLERFSLSCFFQPGQHYTSVLEKLTQSHSESWILCGGHGSGKTRAALALAAKFGPQFPATYLDGRCLKEANGSNLSSILKEIEDQFQEIKMSEKQVVILDNLDELLPNYLEDALMTGSTHAVEQNPSLKDECMLIEGLLCRLLKQLTDKILLITCKEKNGVSSSFVSFLTCLKELSLPLLDDQERANMYFELIRLNELSLQKSFVKKFPEFLREIADLRPGDLVQVASRAKQIVGLTDKCISTATKQVLGQYVPLNEQLVRGKETDIQHDWSDVGGLFEVKRELSSMIMKPSLYKLVYDKAEIRLPRGVLLFGPPGTGKSFIVPALAKKCGFPLITCRGPELLSRYIGASESQVRELFRRAASVAPSIIFLDELDSLAPRRGSDSTGVTDRVVNQLLTFLDGVEDTTTDTGSVFIIAASSRPDKIDPALLRPGRLERHIYVGSPSSDDEWTDLLWQTAQRYDVADSVLEHISSGQMVAQLQQEASHAINYTAADINAVFQSAQVLAAHEIVALGRDAHRAPLRLDHLVEAFRTTKPSLAVDGTAGLRLVYESFRRDRKNLERERMEQKPLRIALR